jgi:hypothetical protein
MPAGASGGPPQGAREGDVAAIAQAAGPAPTATAAPAHAPTPHAPLTHRPKSKFSLPHRATEHVQLHWSAWLAVVPFAAVSLMTASTYARSQAMGNTGTITYMFVSVIWGLVAACAMAWVAWRLRGHTQMAATIAFVATLALISGAGASGNASRKSAQEAKVKLARSRATGEVADAGRRTQLATDHAFDCLKADGGLSLRGVVTVAQLDRRLGLFDDVLRAVRESREAPESVHARLQAELIASGVPLWQQAQVLAEFRDDVDWDAGRRIDDATERLLAAGRNQLVFVRQEWGKIKIDRQTGRCSFQDPKAADRFKQLATEVLTANAALRSAVKEAVHQVEARARQNGRGTVAPGAVAGGALELTPAIPAD